MQEFGGNNALYFKFGNIDMSIRNKENALDNPIYLSDIAKIISSEYELNRGLKTKMSAFNRFNLDTTFRQIEKMYYEQ